MPRFASRLQVHVVLFVGTLVMLVPASRALDCQDYEGGLRWVAGLDLGYSGNSDVTFRGNIAYVAMGKIKVVSVASPANPQFLGELSQGYANPRRISADGDLLVAALGEFGVEIYSTAQPSNPQFLLRYPTADWALDVCLVGDVCFVGLQEEGLLVLDLGDPANPAVLGGVGGDDCRKVAVRGDHLYTSFGVTGGAALIVFDVSDPSNPVETSRWGVDVIDVVPGDQRLYAALSDNRFAVFDLTDPTAPAHLGTSAANAFVASVNGFGDYAFPVYQGYAHVDCYLTDGTPPWPFVDGLATAFGPDVIEFHGGYAYVPSSYYLEVFDLRYPEGSASLLGYYDSAINDFMRTVVARDGYAYVDNDGVAIGQSVIEVLDISDPTSVSLACLLVYDAGYPYDFALRGNYLYVADGLGVDVVDVSAPASAQRVGHVNTPGDATRIATQGDLLLVAGNAAGLQVLSVAEDPLLPSLVSTLDLYEEVQGVVPMGTFALLLVAGGTLKVVDLGDPSFPVELGELTGLAFADNIDVQGSYAYVDGDGEIFVVDLSDPANPVLVGTESIPGSAQDLDAFGGALYISADTAGLQVVDIVDPTQPRLLGSLDLEYRSHGLTVYGDEVLVASWTRLNVAPLDCRTLTAAPGSPPAAAPALDAYPNPFNPSTRIHFTLNNPSAVNLAVYDATGRRLRTLLDTATREAGEHTLDWDGRDDAGTPLASGVYLIRLEAGDVCATGKATLLR